MIARDAPLEETLQKLVRVVESQFAGLLCSVLLLDDDDSTCGTALLQSS